MNQRKTCRIDEDGRLGGVGIHDGMLEEFEFSNGRRSLRMTIRKVSGGSTVVQLSGVTHLTVAGFWGAAILSDIHVWNIASVSDARREIPDGVWNLLFANHWATTHEDARRLSRMLVGKYPDALAVLAECTYGGPMAAICRHLDIDGRRIDVSRAG